MGDLYRANRARKGHLPERESWDTIDLGPAGACAFIVGRVEGSRRRLYWTPQTGGQPHGYIAGPTRGGKSSLLRAWALVPALQNRHHGADWMPTVVLDPKRTGDFAVAAANGVEVVGKMTDIRDRLRSLFNEAERRNRRMGEIEVGRPDARGVMRPFFASKVYDYTPEERERYGMRPMLVLFEELRDLLGEDARGEPLGGRTKAEREAASAARALQGQVRTQFAALLQKAGSAGIHINGAVQQPRADILGGFARDQMGARIVVGKPGAETMTMVMGADEARRRAAEAEVLGPGHGYAVNVGRDSVVERIYVPEFVLDRYAPLAPDPDRAPDEATLADTAAAAATTPAGSQTPRGGLIPGGLRGALAVVVGPGVRAGLRARGLRHLTGELVEGPFYRRESVRREVWERDGGRCRCCGRTGQMEVDHRVPLFAGGQDTTENAWLLCVRPGRASCHRAKSGGEDAVRALRVRLGTARGPAPRPIADVALGVVRMREGWWWGMLGAFVLGLLHGGWWLLALVAFLILGPIWAWYAARGSRLDLRASPDAVVDPTARRGPSIERNKAKGLRGWRGWITRRLHDRASAIAFARLRFLRMSYLYLAGWLAVPALMLAPGIAASLVGILL